MKISHNHAKELKDMQKGKMKIEASSFEGVGRQRGQLDD